MTNNPENSSAVPSREGPVGGPPPSQVADAAAGLEKKNPPTHVGGYGEPGEEESQRGGVGWFGWGFLILLWGYAVYRLGALWYANEAYSFGWFMPLLCLLLFRERWKRRPRREPVRAASGTFWILGLLALILLPALLILEVIPIGRLAAWLFALAVFAITLIVFYFLGGRSYARHFIFPVLFFLIAVPWPLRYEVPLIRNLSELNAAISARVVNHLGTPAVRSGVLIETGSGLVGVDDACSGIRSFQASVMVGLFLGELFRYGFLRRMVLLFGGVGLAFLCNVVRTTFLVRACDLKGSDAVNLYHDQAGFTILGITLAGLLALAWLLRNKGEGRGERGEGEREVRSAKCEMRSSGIEVRGRAVGKPEIRNPESNRQSAIEQQGTAAAAANSAIRNPQSAVQSAISDLPPVTPVGWLRMALIAVIVWVIAIEGGMELWFGAGAEQTSAGVPWSFKPPEQGLEFQQPPISPKVRAMLRYDEGQRAEWRDPAGRVWQLYYLEWLPARSRYGATTADAQQLGHTTDICLVGAGMILQTNFGTRVIEVNGVRLIVQAERLLSRGRNFHHFNVHWKPGMANPEGTPQIHQSGSRLRLLFHALKTRDRDDQGQRVINMGVWEMETDAEAERAFQEYMAGMIGREGRGEKGSAE